MQFISNKIVQIYEHWLSNFYKKVAPQIICAISLRKSLSLQKDLLLQVDFYESWIRCNLYLKKFNSSIAKNLLKKMDVREKKFFENDLLLAALYLDPRYLNLILDKENESNPYSKESRARKKLLEIWSHLKKVEKLGLPSTLTVKNNENNMVRKSS